MHLGLWGTCTLNWSCYSDTGSVPTASISYLWSDLIAPSVSTLAHCLPDITHMTRSPGPSPSILAYYKWSKLDVTRPGNKDDTHAHLHVHYNKVGIYSESCPLTLHVEWLVDGGRDVPDVGIGLSARHLPEGSKWTRLNQPTQNNTPAECLNTQILQCDTHKRVDRKS